MEFESLIEGIKLCGGVAGAISASFACLMLFIKPMRSWGVKKIRSVAKSDDMEKTCKETLVLLKQHIEEDNQWKDQDKLWKQKTNASIENLNETDIVQMRNAILQIYDNNFDAKCLTIVDKDTVIDTFDRYTAAGGNHGLGEKYKEMMAWDVRKSK